MSKQRKKEPKGPRQWLVPGAVLVAVLAAVGFIAHVIKSDPGPHKREQIQVVTLLKPPPEVKEKPPEPQVPKEVPKQTVESPQQSPQNQEQSQDQPQDDAPAGGDLGVDGDGSAGSDGFGLVGKKGGKAITLGGGGGGMARLNLLAKYGHYVHQVQDEVRQEVNRQLEKQGGIPKGKHATVVKVTLNSKGSVVSYHITSSSGEQQIDKAVKDALAGIRISDPPPEGMPYVMTIRIASQG